VLALQFSGAAATVLICRMLGGKAVRPAFPGLRALTVSIVGLVGTISLQYLAFASAPIITANILAYGWPMFVAIGYAIGQRSRRGLGFLGFSVLGFAGVALIFLDGRALSFSGTYAAGYIYALGSAVCMAYFTAVVARFPKANGDAFLLAAIIGAALTATVAFAGDTPWPSARYLLSAVYIGIGPLATGYTLWTHAMTRGEAARIANIGYLTPVLSTALLLAAGETFTAHSLLGALLVIGASTGVLVYRDGVPRSLRLWGRTA